MLTKEMLNTYKVFKDDVFKPLTFKEIKLLAKQKSQNAMVLALERFQELGIVKTVKIGNVATYAVNMGSPLALGYLEVINDLEWWQEKKIPKRILGDIQERVFRYSEYFTLGVFGSHAAHQATPKSDLDIVLIVDSPAAKKEVIPYIETIKRREITPLDYHVFTRQEFLEMLSDDEENLGKQIYAKSKIYYGLIPYYHLIRRSPHAKAG
jgi:predicted nucleotidyltransferase